MNRWDPNKPPSAGRPSSGRDGNRGGFRGGPGRGPGGGGRGGRGGGSGRGHGGDDRRPPPRNYAREAALETLLAVAKGEHLDAALDQAVQRVNRPEDRNLATQIAYGTLRWRGQLDPILAELSTRPLTELEPNLLQVLRLGLFQILYLDRVPPHAAVSESVGLLTEQHLRNFANGLLREALRRLEKGPLLFRKTGTPEDLARSESLPLWYVERLVSQYGLEGAFKAAQGINETPRTYLRTNTALIQRDDLLRELEKRRIRASPCRYSPHGVEISAPRYLLDNLVKDRLAYAQDEASQIIPLLVAPRSEDTILDLCAAPGGKSIGLALHAQNKAKIVAVDRSSQRLKRLETLSKELGVREITIVQGDARDLPSQVKAMKFDRILVDPPCSALGTLHKNPDARWNRQVLDLAEYAKTQRDILEAAWPLLKTAGRLVYSVCSLEPEETTGIVQPFKTAHLDSKFIGAGHELLDHMNVVQVKEIASSEDGFLRMNPWEQHTDGFFAAVLQKS